jgi:hypothetical protein
MVFGNPLLIGRGVKSKRQKKEAGTPLGKLKCPRMV